MRLKGFKSGMIGVALSMSMLLTAVPVYAGEICPGGVTDASENDAVTEDNTIEKSEITESGATEEESSEALFFDAGEDDQLLGQEVNLLDMRADMTCNAADLSGYDGIYLNGHTLTINGNFTTSCWINTCNYGNLIVNGNMTARHNINVDYGDLIVHGDYRQEDGCLFLSYEARTTIDGNCTLSGTGRLDSLNGGTLIVKKDFIYSSRTAMNSTPNIIYEVYGNFTQTGDRVGRLWIKDLRFMGKGSHTLSLLKDSLLKSLAGNGNDIYISGYLNDTVFQDDIVIVPKGDLFFSKITIDSKSVTVKGNMNAIEDVDVKGNGKLTVKGTYTQTDGNLCPYGKSVITIEKDIVFKETGVHGMFDVGPDATIIVKGSYYNNSYNPIWDYVGTGDYKWIIYGDVIQGRDKEDRSGYIYMKYLYLPTPGSRMIFNDSNTCTGSIDTLELNGTKSQYTLFKDGCWKKLIEKGNKKSSDPDSPKDKEQVNAFVERMYKNVLKRASDAGGKGKWTNELLDGKNCGAGLAQGFICSEEFTRQGVSDEEFVDTLYHTFFDRDPDEGGKNGWLAQLKAGMSRNEVCAGFVNSLEFANLCDKFGIARGTMEPDGSYRYNEGVRKFVLRNYTETLGRAGETMGVEDWCNRINKGELSMKDVAIEFLHSQEFLNKNLDDEAYIKVLYRTFMGRDYDEAGLKYWLGEIKTRGRDDIVNGFADSKEFANIMAKYQ